MRAPMNTAVLHAEKDAAAESKGDRALELVGQVCHDLRTPACTIAGFADLLLDYGKTPLTVDQRASLERIRKNAHFMLDMVGSMLDMVRIENGELRLERRKVDLRAVVREACESAMVVAAAKQILVVSDLPAEPQEALCDPSRLAQVVANLLSNALKFSRPGTTVQIGLQRTGTMVEIWVKDEGPGIPQNEQHLLFGKFHRTSVKATAGEKSLGLGLYIVKEIVSQHRGSIAVESLPQRGTTFRVRVPALRQPVV
jgi:signal transduction histidine kinase